MTGENWTDILYASMHSQEHASVTCAALFVVSVYFAVHCKLYNHTSLVFYFFANLEK